MKKTKVTPEEYEKLGRAIESSLINDYIDLLGNTRRIIWNSFVRGVFVGFGTVIGATVVVSIVIFVFGQLGGLPWIGEYLQGVGDTIQQ